MNIKSKYLNIFQGYHEYQGNSSDCGPISASIILNGLLDLGTSGDIISNDLNAPKKKGFLPLIRRIPNWATFPWGMVDIFQENGLRANWRAFSTKRLLLNNLIGDRVSIVLVGGYSPLWAHYMILGEYSPKGEFGFIDPALRNSSVHWIQESIFEHIWSNYLRTMITIYPIHTPSKTISTGQ